MSHSFHSMCLFMFNTESKTYVICLIIYVIVFATFRIHDWYFVVPLVLFYTFSRNTLTNCGHGYCVCTGYTIQTRSCLIVYSLNALVISIMNYIVILEI